MTTGRRYTEQEVAAIFEHAAQAQQEAHEKMGSGEGLTLEELQQIGAEAGITPAFIAQAAAAVDRSVQTRQATTFAGFPISVTRIVELPRALTDAEWHQLVAETRDTFHAHGKLEQEGELRQWRNGNLRIMAEPTGTGHRLRMRTLKGSARELITAGIIGLITGALLLPELAFADGFELTFAGIVLLSVLAIAGLGGAEWTNRWLRNWRETRARQMETLGARALELTSTPTSAPAAARRPEPLADPQTPRLDLEAADQSGETEPPRPRPLPGRSPLLMCK